MPERDSVSDVELELFERLAALEAKAEGRSTVFAVLVLVAILGLALYSSGVLKLDLAAHG